MQWQIVAREPDKVAHFYSKLFDWRVRTDNSLGYRMERERGRRDLLVRVAADF